MKKEEKNVEKRDEEIIVKGARTHNLKNITVSMPRNKMTVFTGLSGSGKSSLAFDTIFAEGQRRYIESLSSYARQFLRQMEKPDVDEISGLSPAISIDQKSRSNNPRSTVATITEIYDYLRILFARIGKPHCLICDKEIKKLSNEEILNTLVDIVKKSNANDLHLKNKKDILGVEVDSSKIKIYAPLVIGRKGEYYQMLYDLLGKGYSEVKVDGENKKLREQIILDKNKKHNIDVLVDEFFVSQFISNNSLNSLDSKNLNTKDKDFGNKKEKNKSYSKETKKEKIEREKDQKILEEKFFRERLVDAIEKAIHESGGFIKIETGGEERLMSVKFMCPYDGYSYPEVEPRMFSFNSPYGACSECNGLGTKNMFGDEACPKCKGARLREEALGVLINGDNISKVVDLSISNAYKFFEELKLDKVEKEISKVLIKEIQARLKFMLDVGIEYLSLSRKAHTLSGGEAQRIRLASQLGSGLVGALYVLDEPTIGLHQRDNDRLIKTLTNLRDMGNTILVVEHDEDTIFASDYIVDIGPKAGIHGGNVVVADYLEPLLTAKENKSGSSTLAYLRGEDKIEVPEKRRSQDKGKLIIKNGEIFNIKNLNIEVPLGNLVSISGVSGSGKSTFMHEIIHKNLQSRLERRHRNANTYNCKSFAGSEYVGRVIMIDQSPIGRTPRSNPATYTGAWTFIRDLFAETIEAKSRGYKQNRFSFNVKGGRCEACQGNGEIEVEMHFLPSVSVLCDVCNGKRFTKDTLEIKYKKKSIYDVLKMTIEEALDFFKDIPAIYDRLESLSQVGLGYLELGQSATTLSGGEAQRVKISSELYRPHLQKTIYLLDEPSIGLHYEDVKKLIEILQKLVQKGNSVVLIEHNMDIIKSSDYIIDIGPNGGEGGGKVVAKGTPEDVAKNENSYTAKYLKKYL